VRLTSRSTRSRRHMPVTEAAPLAHAGSRTRRCAAAAPSACWATRPCGAPSPASSRRCSPAAAGRQRQQGRQTDDRCSATTGSLQRAGSRLSCAQLQRVSCCQAAATRALLVLTSEWLCFSAHNSWVRAVIAATTSCTTPVQVDSLRPMPGETRKNKPGLHAHASNPSIGETIFILFQMSQLKWGACTWQGRQHVRSAVRAVGLMEHPVLPHHRLAVCMLAGAAALSCTTGIGQSDTRTWACLGV
jgi:hypothetical protein